MIVLVLRTDKPEAEVGLYNDKNQLTYETWPAHRQLAETIHEKIEQILERSGKELGDIEGVVVYRGPGSFTGLRIGISVANALAYGLDVPIAAESGDTWKEKGIEKIEKGQAEKLALPRYGSPAHITKPRK